MPAAISVQEDSILFTGGSSSAVRLDTSVLVNRYWVRVINPHPTLRLFISHASGTANTTCESIDPFNGVWEDSVGQNVPIYIIGETGYPTNLYVRIKQYA